MGITELTLKLLLIFFPGIISTQIIDHLTYHKEREFKLFLLNCYLLGVLAYLLLDIAVVVINWAVSLRGLTPSLEVNFFSYLTGRDSRVVYGEVFWTTLIAIFLGIILSTLINHKMVIRIAHKIGIATRFAERDVWGYLFESDDVQWITVRDLENNLMYDGCVGAFSDVFQDNELFLRDVIVYRNSDAEELYRLDGLYITRKADQLTIEFKKLGKEVDPSERS